MSRAGAPPGVAGAVEAGPAADDADERLRAAVRLVEERTGLLVDARREAVLAEALRGAAASPTVHDLAERVVVGETHFLRNRPQLEAIRDVLLPELLASRAATRELRIWSAGCSTGEEAYTLAFLVHDAARAWGIDLREWRVLVLGTDLDARALAAAARATYGEYSFRGVGPDERARWFEPAGPEAAAAGTGAGAWRVRSPWREMPRFERHNLVATAHPGTERGEAPFDLVACRNVTIHMTDEAARGTLRRLAGALAADGALVIGHSEHALDLPGLVTRRIGDAIVYVRADAPALSGTDDDHARDAGRALGQSGAAARSASSAGPEDDAATQRRALPDATGDAARADEAGDAEVAAALAAVEANPSDGAACLLLGRVAADRGRLREAEAWLHRARQLSPREAEPAWLLALVAVARGDRDRALERTREALELAPDLAIARALEARLLHAAGDVSGAERARLAAERLLVRLDDDARIALGGGMTALEALAWMRAGDLRGPVTAGSASRGRGAR